MENLLAIEPVDIEKINPTKKNKIVPPAYHALNSNYRELFQRIERRNGEIVDFDPPKISQAIWKAARSVGGTEKRTAELLTDKVILHLSRLHEDHLLTIEEVQDAVEKVLIEEGHAKTAKAYILYREERSRIRKFRKGVRETTPLKDSSITEQPLEVHTTGEQIVRWDRNRISQALVREAGLPLHVADRISREVERQIIYSKASRLTASLIRELVNAKLLEYGYHEERLLHSSLGIALYDVEQLIQGKIWEEFEPSSLDKTLSGAILRQYSLARVFSQEISEAHLRGDLQIHNLTEPWRMKECLLPLEYLKKTGLSFPDFASQWNAAQNASLLIRQMGKMNQLLKTHVRGLTIWDGINLFLAPLLEGLNKAEWKDIALQLLFETATHPGMNQEGQPVCCLGFYLHIPKNLWDTAALGARGEYSGKTYAYYEEISRQFLNTFLGVLGEITSGNRSYMGPEILIHLDDQVLKDECWEKDREFLDNQFIGIPKWSLWVHGEKLESGVDPNHSNFMSPKHFCSPGSQPQFQAPQFKYPWKLRAGVTQELTLNLYSMALQADGSADALSMILDHQLGLVFTAFKQQKQFQEKLQSKGLNSPVPTLVSSGDGERLFRPEGQTLRLRLWGLMEMLEWHLGHSLDQDQSDWSLVEQFLETLMQKVQLNADNSRLACEVVLETDPKTEKRFRAFSQLKENSKDLNKEQKLSSYLSGDYEQNIENIHLTWYQQVEKSMLEGINIKLFASKSFWYCEDCNGLLQGNPDICSACGSLLLSQL